MTTSEPTDDTRRDAARTGGQLSHSDLTSPGSSRPSVEASPSKGSGTNSGAKPANGARTDAGPSRATNDASSAKGGHESRDPSADAKASSRGEKSDSRQSGGARDESSNGSAGRSDGTAEAARSLIACVEQLVREIPRGAAARFEGVTEEIRKARKALDGATSLASPAARSEGSKTIASAPHGAESGGDAGASRSGRSDEIRPSATPPTRGGI